MVNAYAMPEHLNKLELWTDFGLQESLDQGDFRWNIVKRCEAVSHNSRHRPNMINLLGNSDAGSRSENTFAIARPGPTLPLLLRREYPRV